MGYSFTLTLIQWRAKTNSGQIYVDVMEKMRVHIASNGLVKKADISGKVSFLLCSVHCCCLLALSNKEAILTLT